jgi:Cu/Ag efflux pump CusA
VIRPALRTVPGVADVNALGGEVRSFEVVPDIERLAAQGISLDQLRETLAVNNRNDGAGRLSEGEEAWLVRSEGSVRHLADLAGIVVRSDPVEPVRLADMAASLTTVVARRSRVWSWGCVAPMRARWCAVCAPSWTRSPRPCRRAFRSGFSMTVAIWWIAPSTP